MAFKFSRKGAPFPVEAKNGELLIHIGDDILRMPYGFIKEDYPLEYSWYTASNIMCYLNNGNTILVMRFDGSVTKYTQDLTVIGFSSFKVDDIYDKVTYLPIGSFIEGPKSPLEPCAIYRLKESDGRYTLTILGRPALYKFWPQDNPKYISDIMQGVRQFPGLTFDVNGKLCDDRYQYLIKAEIVTPSTSINI